MSVFHVPRVLIAIIAMMIAAVVPTTIVTSAEAVPRVDHDPAVITKWNEIAFRTIAVDGAKPPPVLQLYLGIVSAAVYNAVVTVEGGYEPYTAQPRAHKRSSPEAAAAVAAHDVLAEYFPASQEMLDSELAASLAAVPNGVGKVHGTRVGSNAAAAIIALRKDDGRDANVVSTPPTGLGKWVPPPTGMLAPWLGYVKPLLLDSPTQISVPGPSSLDSAEYATDYQEVKQYGAKTGSLRSPSQTENALFCNDNVVRQYQVGARDVATRHGLDITESARFFALLNMGAADAIISCWRVKIENSYWRPSTAIRTLDDGNPATEPDPAWEPLVPNPPYPDYISGHACLTGASVNAFADVFGKTSLDLNLVSLVPGSGPARHYDSAAQLDTDTMNGRIWLGIHFRKAMTDGNALGHEVSHYGLDHFFQPTG